MSDYTPVASNGFAPVVAEKEARHVKFQDEPKIPPSNSEILARKNSALSAPSTRKISAEINLKIHDFGRAQARAKEVTEASFYGSVLESALIEMQSKVEAQDLDRRLADLKASNPDAFAQMLERYR
jgi:hypothetical protein